MFNYRDISQQPQIAKSGDNNGGIRFMAHMRVLKEVSWIKSRICTREKNEARGNGRRQLYQLL